MRRAVVARQIELIERTDGGGPLAKAEAARAAGKPVTSRVPATIAGARRMLQVTDVPLGESGVAGYAIDIEDMEAGAGCAPAFPRCAARYARSALRRRRAVRRPNAHCPTPTSLSGGCSR